MSIKKAVILGIILEILLGAAAASFYFLYYVKTPTYAVRQMYKAMQQGDVESLQTMVALDDLFKQESIQLSQLVARDSAIYPKLADGSFGKVCKDDFLKYMVNGKWEDVTNPTEENFFQDRIAFRSMSFRKLLYVNQDAPNEDKPDEVTATAGVSVYAPDLGDTFVLKLKLRQKAEGQWVLYDVENYGEFADSVLKQNERDVKRYRDKVRQILLTGQGKLNDLKQREPNISMNWVIEARTIMLDTEDQLNALEKPRAASNLVQMLHNNSECFHELIDLYYERLSQVADNADKKKKYDDAMAEGKRIRRPYNAAKGEKALAEIDAKLKVANEKWVASKAAVAKEFNLTAAEAANMNRQRTDKALQDARALRNNDDELVRQANYPGAVPQEPQTASPVDSGANLPTMSVDSAN